MTADTALERDIIAEFVERSRSYTGLAAPQALVPEPYIVEQTVEGQRLRLLITDYSGQTWYDLPEAVGYLELAVLRDQGMVQPGSVVFDVGAHQGVFALWFSLTVGPAGHVYAFEPFESFADVVELNARLNGVSNITVVQAAVGDVTGPIWLSADAAAVRDEGPRNIRQRLLGRPGPAPEGTIRGRSVRLDDYADRRPTLLKIDAEGYEARVLRGARRVLRSVPHLDLEIHPVNLPFVGDTIDDVLREVDWSGYECSYITSEHVIPRPWRPGVELNGTLADWIFARSIAPGSR